MAAAVAARAVGASVAAATALVVTAAAEGVETCSRAAASWPMAAVADPLAWAPASPAWRLDLPGAGHQASSDIGLYSELVDQVPDVPDVVRMYLAATAADAVGGDLRPWRTLLREQVVGVWAFLTEVLDLPPPTSLHDGPGSLGQAVLHRR